MTFTGVVAIFTIGAMIVEAVTVSVFARARRRAELYVFAAICTLGACYSLATLLLELESTSSIAPWAAQFGYLCAAAYIALLLTYLSQQSGQRLQAWENVLGRGAPLLVVLMALVPGTMFRPGEAQSYDVLGTAYHQPSAYPTAFLAATIVSVALVVALSVSFRVRDRFFTGRVLFSTLVALSVFGALDMATTLRLTQAPYLAHLAGVSQCVTIAWQLAREWGEEARQLVVLRRGLEEAVEKRSTELSEAKEALAHRDRMAFMGQIAAAVGHEINNPLAYVLGNLEVLKQDLSGTEHDELVTESIEGGHRIAAIVKDLRTLSKPAGRPLRSVQMVDTVNAAARTLRSRLNGPKTLIVEIPETIWVAADPSGLTQVFVNLLSNALDALDAVPGVAHVYVDIRHSLEDSDTVTVQVRDDGPGLDPKIRARLFEPFQSASKDGLGIGLTVVRSLVESFGGRVEVDDESDEGTTFLVTLARAEPAGEGHVEAPPESSGFGDLRVLVVDDEPEIALMLARLLKPAEVHSALNGFAALERLAAESFDLVLCDVVMPGLSGLEVLEELRGRAAPPRFVLMTGGATDEATRNALSASGVPVLYKPFGRRDVMKCVEATQFAGGVAER